MKPEYLRSVGILWGPWQSAPVVPQVPRKASGKLSCHGKVALPVPGQETAGPIAGGAPLPLPLLLLPPPQPHVVMHPSVGLSGQAHNCSDGPVAQQADVSFSSPGLDEF